MPTLRESALHYAEQGFAVFPLIPREKKPATTNGFKDATTDLKQISFWWDMDPNYNIGIATGKPSSGLVVIDIDNGHGGNGSDSLRDWEKQNHNLPDTCTALTGSGGVHLYYRDTEEYRNKAGILDSVDVRGDGGYIVAPPSVHPNGSIYEWEVDHSPDDMKVTMADATVRKFLNPRKKELKQESMPVDEVYPEGKRVDSLVRMIGAMKGWGISDAAIKSAVQIENIRRCDPPLIVEELEKEVFPAIKRDWIPERPYATTESASMLPEPVPLEDIWDDPPPVAPVLIDGVLRQGHKMIISAPSKSGKSFALIELAFAIAEGYNWFGSRCTQGRVLYINMEIDDPSCYRRFIDVYKGYGKQNDNHIENITVWGLRGFSMPLSQLTPEIIKRAGKDYAAIIIDPLYKVMDGDENSNSDISAMVGQFDKIARETGASVIYAHHFAKGVGGDRDAIDRGAGAGTFARDPDAILTMTALDVTDPVDPARTAWRMEYVLREFPNKEPVSFWWNHPLHEVKRELDDVRIVTSQTKAENARKKVQRAKTIEQIEHTEEIVNKLINEEGKFRLSDFIEAYRVYETLPNATARRRLSDAGYVSDGEVRSGRKAWWSKG